jgi:hypothetical protein
MEGWGGMQSIANQGPSGFCRRVRVFWFAKGKLRRIYDESLDAAEELQRGDSGAYRLEAIDFGRRVSIEKDIQGNEDAPSPNAIFDDSGNFIIYATLLGIKVCQAAISFSNLPLPGRGSGESMHEWGGGGGVIGIAPLAVPPIVCKINFDKQTLPS